MIKLAEPFYRKIEPLIPERAKNRLEHYAGSKTVIKSSKTLWKRIIVNYLGNIFLYGVLAIAIIIASRVWLYPLAENILPNGVGKLLATVITLGAMSPFLWAIAMKRIDNKILHTLWSDGSSNQVPIMLLLVFRYLISVAFVIGFLLTVYSYVGMFVGLVIFVILMFAFSKNLQKQFGRLEQNFLNNLNQRERSKHGTGLIHNLHIATMTLHETSVLAGVKLAESNLRKKYGVNIVSILRGTHRLNIPGGNVKLFPGDVLGVIGTDEQIEQFLPVVEPEDETYTESAGKEVKYAYVAISEHSEWIGNSTRELCLRDKYHCLLVGIERGKATFLQPDGTIKIEADDILWVAGEPDSINEVRRMAQGEETSIANKKK